MANYTIGQWLRGKVDMNLADSQIYAACVDFGITPATEYATCGERERDLCLANIYDVVALSSSVASAAYDSDGGWQHRDAVKNPTNRAWFSAEAERLRKKWNVETTTTSVRPTLKNLY